MSELSNGISLLRDLLIETRAENRAEHHAMTQRLDAVDSRLNRLDENLGLTNTHAQQTGAKIAVIESTCIQRGKTLSKLDHRAVDIEKQLHGARIYDVKIGAVWSAARVAVIVLAWAAATAVALFAALR